MTKEERLLGELRDFYRWSARRPMRNETLTERALLRDMCYEFGVRSTDGMSLSKGIPFQIGFASGDFDTHFVVIVQYDPARRLLTATPTDGEMLRALRSLADTLGQHKGVWEDMLRIADVIHDERIDITDVITRTAIRKMNRIVRSRMRGFSRDAVLAVMGLYHYCMMAMIAEEHRYLGKYGFTHMTVLGRKIKLVAMYQVLIQNMDPDAAAVWSKGQDIRATDVELVLSEEAGVDVPLIIPGLRMTSHLDSHERFSCFRRSDGTGRGPIPPRQLPRLERAPGLSMRPDAVPGGCAWWIRNNLTSYSPELKARMAAERRKWRH